MSCVKPITVYVGTGGPNPFKVLIILEELELPYEKVEVPNPKEEWFTSTINPNGRLPAIQDPNTGVGMWESGAILEYLVETYDKDGKLNPPDTASKWQVKQYLHFQMSGQGPYFGQAIWFHKCAEAIPTAIQRYDEQLARVLGVLDDILRGKTYLLGDKLTYADLAFIPWNRVVFAPFFREALGDKSEIEKKYPDFVAWHERLNARPSVKKAYGS
ncbi:Fc.00g013680.m01.CDS01 [Cosmosporella sp. VM-42]